MTKTSFDGGPKDGGPEISSGPLPVLGPLRTCTKCGEVKTLDEYYRDKSKPSGYRTRCKSCSASAWKKWYVENKTEYTQRRKDWYAKNKQRRKDWSKDWREKNPDKVYKMWKKNYHKRRALTACAEVSPVDLADLWTGYCALCGEEMGYDLKYPDPLSKSLDHDVPLSLGGSHSKDNLQWTHLSCNISKGARI